MAGDGGVGFFFFVRRWGEGRGEVVEPRVEAVTDRFCVVVGEQWALPVLGDVCAVAARAYVSFGGATGNITVLVDAVSVVVSVVVGGDSDRVSVMLLLDSISASGGVADGASQSRASVAVAFHW